MAVEASPRDRRYIRWTLELTEDEARRIVQVADRVGMLPQAFVRRCVVETASALGVQLRLAGEGLQMHPVQREFMDEGPIRIKGDFPRHAPARRLEGKPKPKKRKRRRGGRRDLR